MSTEETAVIAVEITVSTPDGHFGELPANDKFKALFKSFLSNQVVVAGQLVDVLDVSVVWRSGELDGTLENRCKDCGERIRAEPNDRIWDGMVIWVDETGGDVCGVVNGDNSPHRPLIAE